ncbi:HMA2 domain-containing protein [Desulfovibrio sp. JC010]|uniref:HMA2 domain-containing protein n=1 Tax=Desulfovibrio sp. JC010 TaxID=2593641 RepID=UPI0013D5576F|nr:hypothetical protein [Desulfovibrio sp. JC010]NDV28547.1 hypothetical protein [Desulfovibrio sp. JC010]
MEKVRVKHSLPHRVRIKLPAVRNAKTASSLEKYAEDIEGIHWARANRLCAGLVVRFDGSVYTEKEVVDMFKNQATQRVM